MTAPTMNTLDYLKGCKPALSIAAWVTNDGASSFVNIGTLTGMEIDYDATIKPVEADTSLFELDQYYTKVSVGGKFIMHETDLMKLAGITGHFAPQSAWTAPTGGTATNPVYTKWVTSTTDGTTILTVTAPPAIMYWCVQLVIDDQSFMPQTSATNVYTKRTYRFPRCILVPKIKHTPKRDDHLQTACEFKALLDTSISTPIVFKITDYQAK